MKPGMKMLLMTSRRGNDRRSEYDDDRRNEGQNERGGAQYRADDRSYERSREMAYGRGETRRMGEDGGEWEVNIDSRFRDRRGREHYDNGRFAPMRNSYGEDAHWPEMHTPYIPPIYDEDRRQNSRQEGGRMEMNRIGFDTERGRGSEVRTEYPGRAEYSPMNEYESRSGTAQHGHGQGAEGVGPLDEHTAREWVKNMENADDTPSPHWTFEQTSRMHKEKGIECNPWEFYATMNMMYSDYGKTVKRFGINNDDFYVEMSKAFLHDKDAQPEKLARYYKYIVKH